MKHRLTCAGTAGAALAAAAAAAVGATPGLATSPAAWQAQLATDPTGAVALGAATLLWLVVTVLAVGVAAAAASRLPGALGQACDVLSKLLLPAALRRGVQLLVGASLGLGVLAPGAALASTPSAAAQPHVTRQVIARHSGDRPLPGRPGDSFPSPGPALGEPVGPVSEPTPTAPPVQLASPSPSTTTMPPPVAPASSGPAVPLGEPDPSLAPAPPRASPPPAATVPVATPPSQTAPPIQTAAPTPTPPPAPTAPPPEATNRGPGILVAPGDSLWSLAASSLGTHASAADIAATWPRWWSANRAAIGADPDLIHPGETLLPPT